MITISDPRDLAHHGGLFTAGGLRKIALARAAFTCAVLVVGWAMAPTAQAQLDLSAAPVWASSENRVGELAFDGLAGSNSRWATNFLGGAGDDQSMRNEWLLVDLGADVNIGRIAVNWEVARAEDYTLRIRTDAQGLPTTPAPVDLDRDSVDYSQWTEIASVVDALSVGNNVDLENPDQIFDWDNNTTFTAGASDGPIVLTDPSPTGRYLLMAITDNWFRDGSTGSSPWEIQVYPSLIPEPGTLSLSLLAVLGLGVKRRLRLRK